MLLRKKHGVATSNAVFLWVNYAFKCNVTPKKVLTTKSRYMYSTILFSVALSLTIHIVQDRVSVKLQLQ